MAFPVAHGLEIAENGFIMNFVVESFSTDPTPSESARAWYNSTEDRWKMSIDDGVSVDVKTFGTKEELDAYIALMISETAGEGSFNVGFSGHTGSNALMAVPAGDVEASLDAMIDQIDADMKDIDDLFDQKLNRDGTQSMTGNLDMDGNKIINVAAGDQPLDAVNKSQLDAVQTGMDVKESARAASTANLAGTYDNGAGTLTGNNSHLTVDDVRLYAGNRVLVKDQTNAFENGMYDVTVAGSAGPAYEQTSVLTTADVGGSLNNKYFFINSTTTEYVVWMNIGGSGIAPTIAGKTAIEVTAATNSDANTIAGSVAAAITTAPDLTAPAPIGNGVAVVDNNLGEAVNAEDWNSGFTITTTQEGESEAAIDWVLTRSEDADNSPGGEVSSGMFNFVEEGTVNGDNGFQLITNDPITLGSTPLQFVQFNGAGQIIAGDGLRKNGNRIDVNFGAGVQQSPNDEVGIDYASDGGLWTTLGGVESSDTDAVLEIKVEAGKGLETSSDGIATVIEADMGLSVSGAGLATVVDADKGIKVDGDGIGMVIESNKGLSVSAAGISTVLESGKSLSVGASGLAVDVNDGIVHDGVSGLSVLIDDFIDTSAGLMNDGANDIQVRLEADGGIVFDGVTGGLEMKLDATNPGLNVDAGGLEVVAGDGIRVNADVAVAIDDFIDTTKGITNNGSGDIAMNTDANHFQFGGSGELQLLPDGIDESLIDWGTGAGQVSGSDMPVDPVVWGGAAANVDAALEELRIYDTLDYKFKDFVVGATTVSADLVGDTMTFTSGTDVVLEADAGSDTITFKTGSLGNGFSADEGVRRVDDTWKADLKAGGGLKLDVNSIEVEPSDFINTAAGLADVGDDIEVVLEADGGLQFDGTSGGIEMKLAPVPGLVVDADGLEVVPGLGMAVSAGGVDAVEGDGIAIGSDIAVRIDDFIDTAAGLMNDGANNIQVRIDTNHLEFDGTTGAVKLTADGIDDSLIDWGTGAGQIGADDIPTVDAGTRYTATTVEGCLDEMFDKSETDDTQIRTDINNQLYWEETPTAATSHTIVHGLTAPFIDYTVLVDDGTGVYKSAVVAVTATNDDTLTVDLTTARKIKIVVRKVANI